MRFLKLMADYDSLLLWDASLGQIANIDPDSLPISDSLKADLHNWAKSYDNTLNRGDPMSSAFSSFDEENNFKLQAHALGERLQAELGSNFSVNVKIL